MCDGPPKRCAMLLLDGNALSHSVLEEIQSHCGVRSPGPNEGPHEADRFRYFLHRHHAQRQHQLHWVQLSAATKGHVNLNGVVEHLILVWHKPQMWVQSNCCLATPW